MSKEEIIKMCEMRADGYTYEEIGNSLGYTKQHVQHTLTTMLKNGCYKISTKTIYPNLEREIKINHKTTTAFAKNTGFKYKRICDVLHGRAKVLLDEAIFLSEYFNKDISYLFNKKK